MLNSLACSRQRYLLVICVVLWKPVVHFSAKSQRRSNTNIRRCSYIEWKYIRLDYEQLACVRCEQQWNYGAEKAVIYKWWGACETQGNIFKRKQYFWIMKFRAMNFRPHFRCTGICSDWQRWEPIESLKWKYRPIEAQGVVVIKS